LAVQARHPRRFDLWTSARSIAQIESETAALIGYLGLAGIESAQAGALSYGGQRLVDMGLALATKPRLLLLDEPLAGLAAAEREHEVVALLGRNGAGKSTLLKSLVGIAPPATGSIRLDRAEIARLPSARIARLGVGYVPQGRGLFAGMTVAHNLELGRLKRQT